MGSVQTEALEFSIRPICCESKRKLCSKVMDKLLLLVCLLNLQTFSTEEAPISNDVTLDYGLIDEIFDQDTKDEWQEKSNSSTLDPEKGTSTESSNAGSSEAVVNEAAVNEAAVNEAAVGLHISVLPCAIFLS